MSRRLPFITLNNGVAMPVLGLGVFRTPPEHTTVAVATALDQGYRLIDTAAGYLNEREVGKAVRDSDIARSEVFVTTKLWMNDYGYDSALRAFGVSLRKLRLEFIDLYLLHWPVPTDFEKTIASYRAAEQLLADGRVRAIGVCNFSELHLQRLLDRAEIVPAVNQVEMHPFFAQSKLREVHGRLGIATQAWSPIGGVYVRKSRTVPTGARSPLEHPVVLQLAREHDKSPAQIVLRWHVQLGVSAIPKSVHASRIAENIDVFDFNLSTSEMASLDALDTGARAGIDPDQVDATTINVVIDDEPAQPE